MYSSGIVQVFAGSVFVKIALCTTAFRLSLDLGLGCALCNGANFPLLLPSKLLNSMKCEPTFPVELRGKCFPFENRVSIPAILPATELLFSVEMLLLIFLFIALTGLEIVGTLTVPMGATIGELSAIFDLELAD